MMCNPIMLDDLVRMSCRTMLGDQVVKVDNLIKITISDLKLREIEPDGTDLALVKSKIGDHQVAKVSNLCHLVLHLNLRLSKVL